LIDKVRAFEVSGNSKIPALALTAYAKDEDRMRALCAGYQMHLSKPIDPVILASAVATIAGNASHLA